MAETRLYPISTLAKLFNITERRVQQLARDGVIPKAERGKYDLVECTRAYIKFLQQALDETKPDPNSDRTRLERARADKMELEVQEARGELARVDELRDLWIRRVVNFKTRMLAIPRKVAPSLVGKKKAAQIEQELDTEIREGLEEIANAEPLGGVGPRHSGSSEAASGAKRKRVGGRKPGPKPRKQRVSRSVANG